jgi:hypothetical protein
VNYLAAILFAVVQVIDFNAKAPDLKLFKNSTTVITVQLQNYTAQVNGAGYTPYFYIAASTTNRNPISAVCAFTVTSNSTFTATFTSNNIVTAGTWIYGCGLSNATGITTFKQGFIKITPDPWR